MSVDAIDEERLRRLLGGVELATLRQRLRARYERSAPRDEFTLTELETHERRALDGLLGRRTVAANSMRLRGSDLDSALQRAGIAATLRAALEFLDGPLVDRQAARALREQEWHEALLVAEPRLQALLQSTSGVALLKRLSGGDAERAKALLGHATRVLGRLPGHGVSRAQLAADVLGDSHGLDNGRPVATLVLRASAANSKSQVLTADAEIAPSIEETYREHWARLGVTVNELALPALCLNLPVEDGYQTGEPVHISLRKLLRRPPTWNVAGCTVYACENPNVVAIAADRLGHACAPLVCTDGMPAAAQQTLLAQLGAAGAQLRYHGDFDWPGVHIGNFVMREFGAEPWRFSMRDYVAAPGDLPLGLPGTTVEARWDGALAVAMANRRAAVHEEAVVEDLLKDLSTGTRS